MNIVTGSGRRRTVLALPHASIVKKAPGDVQRSALTLVCNMLGVTSVAKDKNDGGSAFVQAAA